MTEQDKDFLDRITGYANEVCADIDPQKTQISVQLERLMPILKEIKTEEKLQESMQEFSDDADAPFMIH